MISENFFLFSFFFFGGVILILFVFDIYFSKKALEKKERQFLGFEFSENFKKAVEELILGELKKTLFDFQKQVFPQTIKSLQDTIFSFSQKSEKIILELEELFKKETLRTKESAIKTQDWLVKEIKLKSEELIRKNEKIIENFEKEILKAFNFLIQNMNQKFNQVEKEIENYKKERLKEIDQKIYQIIPEVAKKTIGRIIDISTHEELVWQALEKAKKEKLL